MPSLLLALGQDQLLERKEVDHARIVWIDVGDHAEHLGVGHFLAEVQKGLLEVVRLHHALLLVIILHEALPDLVIFFSLGLLALLFGHFFRGHVVLLV